MKATVPERTGRQQTSRQGVPGHGYPAGMVRPAYPAHQARLRLVADHGRLLPREQAVPRQAVPRTPARQVTARPRRIPRGPVPERAPVRLTRRGRIVVVVAVVLLVAAVGLALLL